MTRNGPNFSVQLSNGTNRNLVSGQHFRLGFQDIYDYFNTLPSRLEDLLRVAMGVLVVDRLSKRRQRSNNGDWCRELSISVEVSDPGFWNSPEVSDALHNVLDDLSGDFWSVTFKRSQRAASYQHSLFNGPDSHESPVVCMYSGGLDSAAGLAQHTDKCTRTIVPVTVISQSRQRRLVKQQLSRIGKRSQAIVSPLMVKAAMIWRAGIEDVREESTQRSRSFLYMSVGAVTAALAQAKEVAVFESGIGSLNIPLMAGMVGSMATRSCHPQFLNAMSHLVSIITQKELHFTTPFADQTKGEMVRWLNESGLADIVGKTVSCVSYPVRFGKQLPCGICSACIFRRQAITAGGISEDGQLYKYDLMSERASSIPADKLSYLRAFLVHASRLPEKQSDSLSPAIQTYLLSSGLGQVGVIPEQIMNLLRRHKKEWVGFAKQSATKGAKWPAMLLGAATQTEGGRDE